VSTIFRRRVCCLASLPSLTLSSGESRPSMAKSAIANLPAHAHGGLWVSLIKIIINNQFLTTSFLKMGKSEWLEIWLCNTSDISIMLLVLLYNALLTCTIKAFFILGYFFQFVVEWWTTSFYVTLSVLCFQLYNYTNVVFTEPGVVPITVLNFPRNRFAGRIN
jgi:hypothetical protein